MEYLIDLQQWIRAAVTHELATYEVQPSALLLLWILPFGAAFGAVHALTPGHGKTILASYLVGSRSGVAGGIAVAGVLSATHVVSAVLLALVGAPLLSRTLTGAGRSDAIEYASGALIVVLGIWLVLRAVRGAGHAHGEGVAVGVAAGLVPCPLTLFAMVFAISRGIAEAGLVFALAMLIGICLTLGAVAVATTLARDRVASLVARHGTSIARISRASDAISGALLVAIGVSGFR